MGADIYLRWKDQTKEEEDAQITGFEEEDAQITGFDVTCGKLGYLRGAYNGHVGWDAIKQLFAGIKEFPYDNWVVDIKILKNNLDILEKTLFVTKRQEFYSLNGKELEIQSYRDFVALAEKKFNEGKKPFVVFSC